MLTLRENLEEHSSRALAGVDDTSSVRHKVRSRASAKPSGVAVALWSLCGAVSFCVRGGISVAIVAMRSFWRTQHLSDGRFC